MADFVDDNVAVSEMKNGKRGKPKQKKPYSVSKALKAQGLPEMVEVP